jgi:hypothetical protein
MSEFHEDSYRTGVWVGQIIGAIANGCRSMSGTWPKDALPESQEALEKWADIQGLSISFDGRFVTIEERQPPKLELVQ